MRCIVYYSEQAHPPLLCIFIHGAQHRRVNVAVIQAYRGKLREAYLRAGVLTPISHPVDLSVLVVDPTSPDSDHLLTAPYQALDGATLRAPGILADGGLIHHVEMSK